MSKTDVVPVSETRLAEFMAAATSQEPVDALAVSIDIAKRILAAETVEDVFGEQEAIHAKDVIGEPLLITGFTFNESTIGGEGPAFYMLIECADPQGEAFKVTCGALNVMAQVFRLSQMGALPLIAKIEESGKPTKAGYRVMRLTAVAPDDARPVSNGAKGGDF